MPALWHWCAQSWRSCARRSFRSGYAEVELKSSEWKKLKRKQRQQAIESRVSRGAGPGRTYYIVDHHHLGIALIEQGIKEVWVTKLDDMSWLDGQTFWRTLEFRAWAHLYDHRGRRRPYTDMPTNSRSCRMTPIAVSPAWSGSAAAMPRTGAIFGIPLGRFLPQESQRQVDCRPTGAGGAHRYQVGDPGKRAICLDGPAKL